jgi:hypothetical protein
MKRQLKILSAGLGLASVLVLLGAGKVSVYFGTVRSIDAEKITLLAKNGSEKKLRINSSTRSFVSGKLLPATAIMPHSRVQIAVDDQDVCLQIVVEEVPK